MKKLKRRDNIEYGWTVFGEVEEGGQYRIWVDRIEDVEEGDNIEYGWTGWTKLKRGDNIEYWWTGLKKLKREAILNMGGQD